jgi:hypothetical protein
VTAAAAPFAIALGFAHVYDDHATLVATPAARLSLAAIARASLHGARWLPDVSRPAMAMSARLDHVLWDARPWGTHLTSLALYALAATAAYALGLALFRARHLALATALLWAAMPVHAEAVVCASYREDLFAALGVFGALALLLAPTTAAHTWHRAAAVTGLAALALAGKESALVLVPLSAALLVGAGPRALLATRLQLRERSLLALGLLLVAYAAWRVPLAWAGDGVARVAPGVRGPHDDARFVVWAAMRSLVPVAVDPIFAPLARADARWWLAAAPLAIAWFAVRRRPIGFALAFLVFGGFATLPSLGAANERADRYLLFTTFGAAALAALGLDAAARRVTPRGRLRHRRVVVALAAALALGLGVRSALAARPFASDLALWTYATARVPTSPKAWQSRAWAERRAGRLADASRSLARSVALDPQRPETRLSAAYLALAQGAPERARDLLQALRNDGHGGLAGFARAWRCANAERGTRASDCLEEGLR